MKMQEILRKIEGLTKDRLYFWESQKFISPKRVKRGKVDRREYTDEDLQMIKAMWQFYSQGITPKIAYEKALEYLRTQEKQRQDGVLFAPTIEQNQGQESQPSSWLIKFTDNAGQNLVDEILDLILEKGGQVKLVSPVQENEIGEKSDAETGQ